MNVSDIQSRLKATIWQAIARSGVDVSVLADADMNRLVQAITQQVLEEVDQMIDEVAAGSALPADVEVDAEKDEQLLWEGRPFLSLSVYYQITSERIRIMDGVFSRKRRDIELVRVQDIDHTQNLTERAFNIGDVFITSHDTSDPKVVLRNVREPEAVHEILRKAILQARSKYNVSFREEM